MIFVWKYLLQINIEININILHKKYIFITF